MPRHQDFEIIGTLYDAAMGHLSWPEASSRLLGLVGGASLRLTALHGPDTAPDFIDMRGFSQDEVDIYAANYIPHDLWLETGLVQFRRGEVNLAYRSTDFVSDLEWRHSQMYTDFCRHHTDTFHALLFGGALPGKGLLLGGIHRPYGGASFRREDAERLRRLMPHVSRAVHLRGRLAEATGGARLSTAAIDRLSFGIVQLATDGRVVNANRAALEIFAAGDGLGISPGGGIRAVSGRDDARLRLVVAQASSLTTQLAAASVPSNYVRIERPSGLRPYAVLVTPLGLNRVFLSARQATTMMLITDPEAGPPVDPKALMSLFGFTPAEARVVCLLITGCALPDIAKRLGIGFETARTHLARVRAKTETTSQIDLVRLVLQALAPVAQKMPPRT